MKTTVKKIGDELIIPIPDNLAHHMGISTGTPITIEINNGSLVATVNCSQERKSPTLKEMIAMCDLNAPSHPDLVAFDGAPATGKELL